MTEVQKSMAVFSGSVNPERAEESAKERHGVQRRGLRRE